MSNVTLYSTGCPKCKIAEKLLSEKDIFYSVITDKDKITEIADSHGFTAVPFAEINGEITDSAGLFQWINNQ